MGDDILATRLDAMQVLQARRTQYLTDSALRVALRFEYQSLPKFIKSDVHILGAIERQFWAAHPGWFNPDFVRANMIGST
jgi:hypothetical protein